MHDACAHSPCAMTQCTAKSKRSGERCKGQAVTGRKTCRMHGGTAKVGMLSPRAIHGRRSGYLPTRLIQNYQAAMADPELLGLRNDVALLEARLLDVLQRVDTGESSALWGQLQEAAETLRTARRNRDLAAMAVAVEDVLGLIDRGHADWAAWNDVRALLRDKKAMAEAERRRLVDMQQMVSATEVMTLAAALSELVRTHVPDEEARRQIGAGLMRLLGGAGR